MIKTYIIPQLSEIRIDHEISLRLSSDPENLVYEPGSGGAGLGGEGNGSGESGWDRTSFDVPTIFNVPIIDEVLETDEISE